MKGIETSISYEKDGQLTERFDTPDEENIIELNGVKASLLSVQTGKGANKMKTHYLKKYIISSYILVWMLIILWQARQVWSFMHRLSSCGLFATSSHGHRLICF